MTSMDSVKLTPEVSMLSAKYSSITGMFSVTGSSMKSQSHLSLPMVGVTTHPICSCKQQGFWQLQIGSGLVLSLT